MTKIAHFGDIHLDKGNKFEDTLACFDRGIDDAINEKVELFVIAGDVFEKKSLPAERNLFAQRVTKMAEQASVVIIQGNHDVQGDLDIFGKLEGKHRIIVHTEPGSIYVNDELIAYTLPYPRFEKSHLMSNGKNLSIQESNEQIRENLIRILREFVDKHAGYPEHSSILIGHINISGSQASTGQTMIGNEIELSAQDLAVAGAEAYLLGHIHKHQEIEVPEPSKGAYCGSINRMNYGEQEEKGYLLWTIEKGKADYEFRSVNARAMLIVDREWGRFDDDSHGWIANRAPRDCKDADVRVRYSIPEDMKSEVDEAEIKEEFSKAHELKIERVLIPRTRIRSEEIAKAKTVQEKLEAYWKNNSRPDKKTAKGCLDKLALMETVTEEQIVKEVL